MSQFNESTCSPARQLQKSRVEDVIHGYLGGAQTETVQLTLDGLRGLLRQAYVAGVLDEQSMGTPVITFAQLGRPGSLSPA